MDTQKTGLMGYYPEMGEAKPQAKIEAQLGHYGRHYYVYSAVPLAGRGVELLSIVKPGDMTNSRRDGWGYYKVTVRALEVICKAHAVSYEMML